MATFFVDFQKSKAKPTLFLGGNCFLIASTISENSLQQMLLSVLVDSSIKPHSNRSYDLCSTRFGMVFHAIRGKMNSKMR